MLQLTATRQGRDWEIVLLLEVGQVGLTTVWCLRRIVRGLPCWLTCECRARGRADGTGARSG